MKQYLLIFVFIISMIEMANGQSIRFVTPNGAGAKTGLSWSNAYDKTQLQTAINETTITQVWVATGTYKPTTGTDRTISFQMKNGVAIYGGFAGAETSLSQRNWKTNVTILSGDLNGDDVVTGSGATLTITGNTENSYHVFYHPASLALTSTAILDGFTITGGNSIDYGGGIYNYDHESPSLANCIIKGNYAAYGGGLCNNSFSSPTMINCTLAENFGYYQGGGVYNVYNSSPVMKNCEISENLSLTFGGGIFNSTNSSPTLTNCLIVYNSTANGGGIFTDNYSSPILTNCTITGNSATNGGGVYNSQNSAPVFNNSIIWGNMAATNGSQICNNSTISLNYSCYDIREGDVFNGAGSTFTPTNCTTADPKFINPNNKFSLAAASPCLDAGSNSYNNETTDIRGTDFGRKLLKTDASQAGTIDMGAYELKKGTDPEIPEVLIIYVKADASDSGDGKTWPTAFKSLQSALTAAQRYYEIWVAAGTYKPTSGSDRTISFQMKNDLAIYGGFKGTETSLSERNWKTNVTILSGDLSGNDVVTGIGPTLSITGNTENSLHVVYNSKLVYGNTILDGFSIKGGNANDQSSGGGIYNGEYSSLLLANCTISENSATWYGGGGIGNSYSSLTITNCTIARNYGSDGGGINSSMSSPILTNCLIVNNFSRSGGGIMNGNGSSPLLTNCTISGNHASSLSGGGGITNNNGKPIINNSIIWGNTAINNGHKQMYNYNNSVITLNYSCYANGTDDIYNQSNTVSFTPDANCINTAPKFVDGINDFRIVDTSPCADTGFDSYNTQTTDIRGFQFGRKLLKTNASQSGPIDIGAFEFHRGLDPGNPTNGGTIDDVEAICGAGSTPPGIKSTSLPAGHVGTLEYKWQLSTISGSSGFTDIASSNSETYNPGPLTTATWFKRLSRIDLMTDWVGAAESNVLQIKIDPVTVGGFVSGSDFVCSGNNSTLLTLSGQTGNVLKWQSTTDDWKTFSDIINTTTTFTATNLTNTTKYRAVVQSGVCNIENSADATVTVISLTVPTIDGSESLCVGTNGVTYTTEIGMTGYNWIVSAGGTITSGTSTNSINVSWNTAGAQTVSVNYANSNSCSAASSPKVVTVYALPATPTISPSGPLTFCDGGSVTLTSSTGTGYKWSTGATTSSINVTTSGSYTVQVTNSNGCQSAASLPTVVVVNDLPVVDAGISTTIPYGTSTTINATVTGTGPFTYSWSPSGKLVNASIEDPATVNLTETIVFTLTATSTTTSCANTGAVTITVSGGTVSSTPTATPGTICAGADVQLDAVASGGSGSYTYSWTSVPSGFTSTLANPIANPLVNTTYHVAVSDGLTTVNTQVVVIVNALPATPSITADGPLTFCDGGSVTLTSSTGTGYKWSTGATTSSIDVTTSGSYTVQVTNENDCQSAVSLPTVVTVNNGLVASVSIAAFPSGAISAGTSVTFTATPINGGSTPTYIWKKGGIVIPLATSSTYTSTTLVEGDVITVEMTSSATCAQGSPAVSNSITMVVNQENVASVSISASDNNVCAGTPVTFTATPTNGGTSPTYVWYLNNVAVHKGVSGTYVPKNGDAIYVVMTSNLPLVAGSPETSNIVTMIGSPNILKCGKLVTVTSNVVTMTVNPASVGGRLSGGSNICSGSNSGMLSLSGHIGTIIKWQSSVSPFSTWTDIANTTTTYASDALTQTTQFRAVVQSGNCAMAYSTGTTVTVKSVPAKPIVTVVNNCSSSTLSIPKGGTILWSNGANTSSITVTTAGTYTVTRNVDGCTSAEGSGFAAPGNGSVAQPGNFTISTSNVCRGSSNIVYSVPPVIGVTYKWFYLGFGATITGSGNSVMISFSDYATSGILSVRASNGYKTSLPRILIVDVTNPPAMPAYFTEGKASVSQGESNVRYTVPYKTGLSYIWDYSGVGATITGTSNSVMISFTNTATSGTLYVRAYNTCGISEARSGNIIVNTLKDAVLSQETELKTIDEPLAKNELKVYPNPSSVPVTFDFKINENAKVTLDLTSIDGKRIATIFDADVESGITHTVIYKEPLSTGIYIYSLKWKDQVITGKLIRTK